MKDGQVEDGMDKDANCINEDGIEKSHSDVAESEGDCVLVANDKAVLFGEDDAKSNIRVVAKPIKKKRQATADHTHAWK